MKSDWLTININRAEAARYLGFRGVNADPSMTELIEECIAELEDACTPRSVWDTFPIIWTDENKASAGKESLQQAKNKHAASWQSKPEVNNIQETDVRNVLRTDNKQAVTGQGMPHARTAMIAGMETGSRNLEKNLRGCSEAVLLATTIGPGCDLLVRRAQVRSMAKAAALQACGAAMVEAYTNEVNRQIIAEAEKRGLYARPRFSPGYGDFALAHQKDFFRILPITRTIGVSLSDSLLMTPTKSVTALIGLSETKRPCIIEGCETCEARSTCAYARET
jgi:hypothetical protein